MQQRSTFPTVQFHELLWEVGLRSRAALKESLLKGGLEDLWNHKRREESLDERLGARFGIGNLVASYITEIRMEDHPSQEFPIMYYLGNKDLLQEDLVAIVYDSIRKTNTRGRGQYSFGTRKMSKDEHFQGLRDWTQKSLDNDRINLIMLDSDTARLLQGLDVDYSKIVGILPHSFTSEPGKRTETFLNTLRRRTKERGLAISPYPANASGSTIPEAYLLIAELATYINIAQMSKRYPGRHAVEGSGKPTKRFKSL